MFTGASDKVKIALICAGSAVLIALVVVLGALIDRGRDTTAIMTLVSGVIIPILGALLYGKVATVAQQTNGNHDRLMSLVERSTLPSCSSTSSSSTDPGGGSGGRVA